MGRTDKAIFKVVAVVWSWNFYEGVLFIINANMWYTKRKIL